MTLTTEGARIAVEVERRHLAIRDFLTGVLGIPDDRAEATACKMEHVLEPEILAYFVAHAEKPGGAVNDHPLSPAQGSRGTVNRPASPAWSGQAALVAWDSIREPRCACSRTEAEAQ